MRTAFFSELCPAPEGAVGGRAVPDYIYIYAHTQNTIATK